MTGAVVDDMATEIGTFFHDRIGRLLVERGVPFMQEVRMNPWLPEGWSGKADWLLWHPKYQAFVLGDLKTVKGEGIRFIRDGGAKTDHIWQLSAYWYAARKMGLPLIKGFGLLYLPKNDTPDKNERIEPILHECDPIEEDVLMEVMESRWAATKAYKLELEGDYHTTPGFRFEAIQLDGKTTEESFLAPSLAPVQPRIQKVWWNSKQEVFDLKLHPHWSAAYCPYPNELCDCSEQGITKIGHYLRDGTYVPRQGFEGIHPEVEPSRQDYNRRRKA